MTVQAKTTGAFVAAAIALAGAGIARAAETTLINTGLEAPAFTVGNIDNQAGWDASINAAVNYDATISTARAAAGSQSLRLSNGVVNQPNFPRSFASYNTPSGTLISLGGPDLFFMTAKVFVEQAAPGGWGMGLTNSLGGLVGMSITADGRLSYANMNSPTLSVSDTGLSLLNTWVTLTMQLDASVDPDALLLGVSTNAGSWSGWLGMPTTSNTATTFYVGSTSTTTSTGLVPLAYFDDVRVGYNMAAGGPTDPPTPASAPATLLLVLAGLAAMGVQARRRPSTEQ